MEHHKKYTAFLNQVVASNKDLDENNAGGIEWLRGRFINLKNENKKLNERKSQINAKMEIVKDEEKIALANMTSKLYEK